LLLAPVFVAGVMITVSLKELVPQALDESKVHGIIGLVAGAVLVKLGLLALGE
jgi:zinc transporter ZupT